MEKIVQFLEQMEKGQFGNTKNCPAKKKRDDQSKYWCFTWNNYPDGAIEMLQEFFSSKSILYIFGEEIGGENATPHLQGYIECPNKCRWSEFKLDKTIHWGKRIMTREHNIQYCSKDGKYYCSRGLRPTQCIRALYPWQLSIEKLYSTEPNGRTLHWYWEAEGGAGKSSFCKYMYVKHKVPTIQGGKLADIMNIVFNLDMGTTSMLLIDIPRNNKNKVSYSAIECILNGMITNTKFETGIKVFNPPHVVCLANCEPDRSKLSQDRWHIVNIKNNRPVETFIRDNL